MHTRRGRSIERPRRVQPVTEHSRWPTVLQAFHTLQTLRLGHLMRAQAAKKLRVRQASLMAIRAAVEDAASTATMAALEGTTEGYGRGGFAMLR